jgi:hypothetical protein
VPAVALLATSIGVLVAARRVLRSRVARSAAAEPELAERELVAERTLVARRALEQSSEAALWALCIFASYGMWLSDTTPIFGGTKHWMTAYPFIALFAGQGFAWLRGAAVAEFGRGSALRERAGGWLLAACLLVSPLYITAHSHPWGLSAYTPLVGGASGAATLGLNRTFWGYTTGAVQDYINAATPEGGRVFIHDTAQDSFQMLQKDRRIRRDIKPWGSVSGSDLALYHHEPHMSRVEQMIWVDYGTTTPSHIGAFDGVPIVWLYDRHRSALAP